jgi:excisionase family DNA binding protein
VEGRAGKANCEKRLVSAILSYPGKYQIYKRVEYMYIEDQIKGFSNSVMDLKQSVEFLSKLPGNMNYSERTVLTEKYDELLTVKEIAKIIKSNPTYVYNLIRAGHLPYLKLGSIKIRRTTLEAFLQKYEGWDLTDPFCPKPINK